MKKLIQFIKNLPIKQILTIFLASSLVFVSTACNKGNVAQAEGKEYTQATKTRTDTYDEYDANQSFKGGMNGYNDDRRYDSGTAAKTKELIDTAERRKADNLGEYVDNVGERSVLNKDVDEKATKAFSRKLEDNKDKALEYVDDKSDKLQRNLGKVPEKSKKVFDGAVDTAQDAIEDATKATKKTTKNIKGNFEDLT